LIKAKQCSCITSLIHWSCWQKSKPLNVLWPGLNMKTNRLKFTLSRGCGLLLQMSHVALSLCVCLFVSLCVSVRLLGIRMGCGKTAEPIEMPFWEGDSCRSTGPILGVFRPIENIWSRAALILVQARVVPIAGPLQTYNQLTTPTNCGPQKLRARVLQHP